MYRLKSPSLIILTELNLLTLETNQLHVFNSLFKPEINNIHITLFKLNKKSHFQQSKYLYSFPSSNNKNNK